MTLRPLAHSPARPLALLALALCLLLVGAASVSCSPAPKSDPYEELIHELICPSVPAGRPLAAADTADALQMRDFIRTKFGEGWSRQRIVDTLVRQYGEQILPSPPKEGFGLLIWLAPIVTIFGGAALMGVLLTGWLRERKRHDAYLIIETRDVDERDLQRYEAQLREDLRQFE